MWLYVLYVVAVFLFYFLLKKDPPKVNGVYSQPSKYYWLKFYTFYVLLKLRQRKARQQESVAQSSHGKDDDEEEEANLHEGGWRKEGGGGKRSPKLLERMHPPPSGMPRAVDAVYFNAANMDGYYFSVGTAQRPNRVMNAFFMVRVPDLGLFENIEMPTTNLPVRTFSLPHSYQ